MVYILLYVKGCQVQEVLFPMERKTGRWLHNAYVILRSPDDVDKALTKCKDKLCLGTRAICGKYLKVL